MKFVHNLKSNFLFLISEIMAIALFLNFDKCRLLFLGIIFLISVIFSLKLNNIKKFVAQELKELKEFGIFLTTLTCLIGVVMFRNMWCHSSIIKKFSDSINISSDVFLCLFATIISVFSIYFLYHFLSIVLLIIISTISKICSFFKIKFVSSFADIKKNLVSNIYLSISFIAFLGLNIIFKPNNIISYIISIVFIFILSTQFNSIAKKTKEAKIYIKVISLITSVGICYYSNLLFKDRLIEAYNFTVLCKNLNIADVVLSDIMSIFIMVLSLYSIYILLILLYSKMIKDIKNMFVQSTLSDKIVITIILFALFGFTIYSFTNTQAFYGSSYIDHDIIYTSDTSSLVQTNAYMNLMNAENDIRQPLFAVFASPFVGAGYLISLPLSVFCSYATPLIMNYCQIILLVLANFMVVKLVKLNSTQRAMLMIIFSLTYTVLLSSLMMEQYIVAYFWLIYMVYEIVMYGKAEKLEYIGASGSLLTSVVFLPLTSNNLNKNWKIYFEDMQKTVVIFLFSICIFNRCDALLNCIKTYQSLSKFTGKGVSLIDRIRQYSAFVSNCFIHPNASVSNVLEYPTWQLNEIDSFNIVGIIIFLVAITGFILNRKNKLCQISLFWIIFSLVVLVLIGWGSAENGMILYSLYFSWAFIVLIYNFILSVFEKIKMKKFVPVFSGIIIVVMIILNFPAIHDLLEFAIEYYPI